MCRRVSSRIELVAEIGKPIIVTENGVEDPSDRMRPQYLVEHIHQLWRAVNAAWQIKGYFHWSLVDNFEWEHGWSQRFGHRGLDPRHRSGSAEPAWICMLPSAMKTHYPGIQFTNMLPRFYPGYSRNKLIYSSVSARSLRFIGLFRQILGLGLFLISLAACNGSFPNHNPKSAA